MKKVDELKNRRLNLLAEARKKLDEAYILDAQILRAEKEAEEDSEEDLYEDSWEEKTWEDSWEEFEEEYEDSWEDSGC